MNPDQVSEWEQTRMRSAAPFALIEASYLLVFVRLLSLDLRKNRLESKMVDKEKKKQNGEKLNKNKMNNRE